MTKLKLTWDKTTKRWCKVHKGHKVYLGSGKSKADQQSYLIALDQWAIRKAEIDASRAEEKPNGADYLTAIGLRQAMLEWLTLEADEADEAEYNDMIAWLQKENQREHSLPGVPVPLVEYLTYAGEHNRLTRELEQLNRDFQKAKPPALNEPGSLTIDPLAYRPLQEQRLWFPRLEGLKQWLKWQGVDNHASTIAGNLDTFLEAKRQKALAGQYSPASYSILKARLDYFRRFAGALSVEVFGGKQLEAFTGQLHKLIAEGTISTEYAKGILVSAKSFVRWLWESEVVEHLPRNIAALRIKSEVKPIETFAPAEVNTLLTNAVERTRLYLLLMLNTGSLQQDISDLKPSEVNWKEGRITRKRSKTKGEANVPIVEYLLWPDTFALLKKYRSTDPNRVLVNANGSPLRQRGFRADGSNHNLNNITSAYQRVCRKLGIPAKPLKLLRKTGASMLETQPEFGRYAQFYLGHSPRSVADRHYVQPSKEQFDRALTWLGQQFKRSAKRTKKGGPKAQPGQRN
jgi:integrase